MCGIIGSVCILNPCSCSGSDRIEAALGSLSHRGPDSSSVKQVTISGCDVGSVTATLGHARLSIIDLSDSAGQPMSSKNGDLTIIFNGEIYNYIELRAELEATGAVFVTNSDTEVLLMAWKTWGASCLQRLNGMFAFAVLDLNENSVSLVRDAFGIKPLFYNLCEKGLTFSSEAPALLTLLNKKPKINWQKAYDFLVFGACDENAESFYEGVHTLLPGELLKFDISEFQLEKKYKWWLPNFRNVSRENFSQSAERLRSLFVENVKLNMRSDVPLGAALSGGIDSSAIVCAMRYIDPHAAIHTFSFVSRDKQKSEERWIGLVNDFVGSGGNVCDIDPDEMIADFDNIIKCQGEPFASMSIYAQYKVYQLARSKGVTVTLDGQGADELLGGYGGYPGQRIASMLDNDNYLGALRYLFRREPNSIKHILSDVKDGCAEILPRRTYDWARHMLGLSSVPQWINKEFVTDRKLKTSLGRHGHYSKAPGRRMMATLASSLTGRGLPTLLRYGDRNSMRFSVESRVPFLSLDMVNACYALPEEFLVSPSGQTKSVFREALRDIVPEDILARKDKIGFEPPEKIWFLKIAPVARQWILESVDLPLINKKELLNYFDDFLSGKVPFSWKIWRIIIFFRWKGIFIDRLEVAE
ncbi:asparagine synthase (glutamine-hydrolyzing) [Rhodobacterales bacterium LSUCC0246]|nr:asparagine synthase (glutamine-hydrolyzing) [Rhodobacterales bacterium LSUCC0374]